MSWSRAVLHRFTSVGIAVLIAAGTLEAQTTPETYQPEVGQAGRDAVWVPTSPEMVETMLDLARVTPEDLVVDLGSGDGRMVIAAARRGARGLGVEYNPDLVELSKRIAEREGVSDRAEFVQGDMYEANFSEATVLALFLLSENLRQLLPKFLQLQPGTRIVVNTYGIDGWEPDATANVEGDCSTWCHAMLYIVPARIQGTWQLPQGTLSLEQEFQKVSGTLESGNQAVPVENGRLSGEEISFVAGGTRYDGRVNGDVIEGTVTANGRQERFTARRM
jgi:precorrin-6B methylase 2